MDLNKILDASNQEEIFVVDYSISIDDYVAIDLSKQNEDLKLFDVSSSKAWEIYINNYLKKANKKVAYGGYLEHRNLYDRSDYFSSQTEEAQRNIHLGLDLWCPAGTNILAAFNGVIHSFNDNTNFGDYGPTIILEHSLGNDMFYTLYGHLSRASIKNIKVGQSVKQGDIIAQLGDAKVNGDYAPHLHFQIIKDLQGKVGDYPGVCNVKELEFYKQNTIDPKPILGLV
ncbi:MULTISPECIES: peptidoglycan DD-metalloendopeptidase family protein [Mesoflavibacter]|uniref:Peptidase M23 n=1 Tax=Mesoflavibacter zeaxanthinifaciens subsp. sabulilitoris TaxID=1520893 RepID=A0A2T1NAY7_9FLAO|nr:MULTISPECIES: peptidoglycan DD-metalloendopeptidase family protein [Mesoflavibacter]MBB3123562.1 murein DD-endopeptidase MepM/ murein hydrolase activator NlpD [Mesoflavibacter zeaxanthinifaciens subsp. sabulilitoris]PSG89307.1 peptidase M23 [Mesoflavibacter zeaxanthinifaciens subsp. sabulilitoris]UAB74689.1 peptidoglycan DD-metalloendopeptidase family protein [Mesoflavibacter sp. SCSIO 43206]